MIDDMQSTAPWAALSPDGVTPSAALSLAADASTPTPSGDARSIVATRAGPALNHRLRRSIPPVDLATWPELRLTMQADVATGSRPESPFYLELRLGSAAAPIGAPGNDWHRRLAIERADAWEAQRLSLVDLPGPVRGALDQIELRCVADTPFAARIDQLVAARRRFPGDVDEALVALLDQRVTIAGAPVPAAIIPAGGALPETVPLILIQPYDLRPAWTRDAAAGTPGNFMADGTMRLAAASDPFELDYAIEARAADRTDQALLVDFLLGALPRQGTLLVNGEPLRAEWITAPGGERCFPIERQLIFLRVTCWRERRSPITVAPVKSVSTRIDPREPADG
ncbi:MAG: hypothetical protein B7Y45_02990 [Sphingomonas sp. 28-66-16]|nr:MAG: hypothetical protein B7Y45_02990 [Sphingomonas sp. 28-66-16]